MDNIIEVEINILSLLTEKSPILFLQSSCTAYIFYAHNRARKQIHIFGVN